MGALRRLSVRWGEASRLPTRIPQLGRRRDRRVVLPSRRMPTPTRHRRRAVVALAWLSALASAPDALAFCRSRTGPGQPDPGVCSAQGVALRWYEPCAGYAVAASPLPDGWTAASLRAHADRAARQWAAASCDRSTGAPPSFALAALDGDAPAVGYVAGRRNANTVAFRARWDDDAMHRPGTVAVTLVTYEGATGQIVDADTELNAQGFRFSESGEAGAADLPTILLHELGHAQGLAHSGDRDAVMWFNAGVSAPQRAVSSDDALGVCAAYPPGPSSACDPLASGAPRPDATTDGGCSAGPGAGSRGAMAWLVGLLAASRRRRRIPS